MKTWNQLFVRHGWYLEQKDGDTFNCQGESRENLEFLMECLQKAEVPFTFKNQILEINGSPLHEANWIERVSFSGRGKSEIIGLSTGLQGPPVREFDTFISGIVRQLNRLGFNTLFSCHGHGKKHAHVGVTKDIDIQKLVEILLALGIRRVYYREVKNHYYISLSLKRYALLDLAEKMSLIEKNSLNKGYEYIKEQLFYKRLHELLEISGTSGNEREIRDVVKEQLTPFVDFITIDRHGNLLAEKTYGRGNGPTILLNAHLDNVMELLPNRTIIKREGIRRSSQGILGADDRAGVAVLLQTAENLINSSFKGKVKYIFTVEEECGLIGASQVDDYFLWGVDAAFVVDRRGTGDIVTSYGGYIPFCDDDFGIFVEQVANEAEIGKWKCTNGGSSDTRIWAEHGIQSVNLSAGYGNEHTEEEYLDIKACYNVTKLLNAAFANAKELRSLTHRINLRNTVKRA